MIEINELSRKLSAILNGLDDETSSIFNPATSFDFVVKTYGTHLDSIADKVLKKNIIPVYIANFSGNIQPIPNLREENTTYDIYIYFPIKFKDTFFRMGNFLIECFAGKMLNFGNDSGVAITNLNSPTLVDIQQTEFTSFQKFLDENYSLPIQRTELWGAMSFSLFFHQVANLGQENGFIVGNQVKHEIAFTYDEKEYKEELVVVSGARNLNSDTISEQRIYQLQTSGIAKNTSYIDSVQAYARDNDFWRKFIELYETGLLQNMVFDYTKIYNLSRRMTFKKKAYLTQCPSSDSLGETKTFTFTFIKPVGSGQDIVDIESKLRIPRITTYAMFEFVEKAEPPIITDITISNIQKVSSLINFDSTSWEEKPTNAQGLYYQTKKTYSLSQVEGGTGNKNIQVKTGWEIDSNGDMHLHFFTRNKISQIGSSTWQGYMFGRKDTSTTFNDGKSSESANVIKTNFAWTSGATPTFYFQRPNENTQLKLDNRVVKSQNAYLLKNMELIPQGEMYYYDVNIGDVETTQNNVNFIVVITLYLANNELLNLSDSFRLYNNGEYN